MTLFGRRRTGRTSSPFGSLILAEIRRMKERPGKDIGVGGSNLALSFVRTDLLDEFRFMVTPVVLGRGTPILDGVPNRMDLELTKVRRFSSGNTPLYCGPVRKK